MTEMTSAVDDASVLIVLVETNPGFWESPQGRSAASAAGVGLDATLRQLMVFVNAYLSLNQQNRRGLTLDALPP
jgi:hypothetical protein